jgi:hypothetical protein
MEPIPVVKGSHRHRPDKGHAETCCMALLLYQEGNWIALPTRNGYSVFRVQPGAHFTIPDRTCTEKITYEHFNPELRLTTWRYAFILDKWHPVTAKRTKRA